MKLFVKYYWPAILSFSMCSIFYYFIFNSNNSNNLKSIFAHIFILILLFSFEVTFYCFLGAQKKSISEGIFITTSKRENKFHRVLEIFLIKWDRIKNNPRGNYLLIKATFLVFNSIVVFAFSILFLTFLHFSLKTSSCNFNFYIDYINSKSMNLENDRWKILLGLLSAISLTYWNIHKEFHERWIYLANLFNLVEKESLQHGIENAHDLRRFFCIDALRLDMWAQSSFRKTFKSMLEFEIKIVADQNLRTEYEACISKGEFTNDQIEKILNKELI